jgi:hypothetical protein
MLLLELFIFLQLRKLRVPRNLVHINLFVAISTRTMIAMLISYLRTNKYMFNWEINLKNGSNFTSGSVFDDEDDEDTNDNIVRLLDVEYFRTLVYK